MFLEDSAALVGLALALSALVLHVVTGWALWDGAASLLIGLLLPQLVLRDLEDRHGDGDVWSFVAELAASGLTATSGVTILRGHGLSEFFAGLVEDWRGWQGERLWESPERELRLAAVHEGWQGRWLPDRLGLGWVRQPRGGSPLVGCLMAAGGAASAQVVS